MKFTFSLLLLSLLSFGMFAQKTYYTNEALLEKFMDMKFGMFVHWGPVSLKGTEIGWSRGREVPVEEYDNLYKSFNPKNFDADEWIKTAKESGMKYFIITARHHDGFSIWQTEYSDYDIASTPYKKDVLMALKRACDKYGILFGTYYSINDWKHPYYPLGSPGGKTKKKTGDMEKFIPFIKGQTKELIEKYDTKILWFDGEWEEPWTHEMGQDLYQYLKSLDEDILINNRVDKGRKGMEGITVSDEYAGDFATPEQQVGAYDIEKPWESCITICRQWAWKPDDKMKSLEETMSTLLKTVGGGGNLLLNVGPMPDGRIEPRQVTRLKEMGDWLDENGESVYGTTGGPYKPTEWLASTRKENALYIHLLNHDKKDIVLPFPFNAKIRNVRLMNGGILTFVYSNGTLVVQIPDDKIGKPATTFVIETNKNTSDFETVELN